MEEVCKMNIKMNLNNEDKKNIDTSRMQNVEGVYKFFDDSCAYLLLFCLWVYHACFIFK